MKYELELKKNINEAILTGYVRYRPNGGYFLMANSRMICHLLKNENRLRIKVFRKRKN